MEQPCSSRAKPRSRRARRSRRLQSRTITNEEIDVKTAASKINVQSPVEVAPANTKIGRISETAAQFRVAAVETKAVAATSVAADAVAALSVAGVAVTALSAAGDAVAALSAVGEVNAIKDRTRNRNSSPARNCKKCTRISLKNAEANEPAPSQTWHRATARHAASATWATRTAAYRVKTRYHSCTRSRTMSKRTIFPTPTACRTTFAKKSRK